MRGRWNHSAKMLLLGLLLGLSACGGKAPEPEAQLRPVRYEQVFASGAARVRSFSGISQAGQEARLSFKVGGTIQRLAVELGDRVQAGQLLAQLDDSDYSLQLQSTDASLESARAMERRAVADYNRVRALYENNNASRNDLDAARAAKESAEADVRSLENTLELQRLQLGYCRLNAPVDGAVASLDAELNENVSAGQIILMLSSGEEPEVELGVPEMLITQIDQGDAVAVSFDAIPQVEFPGVVTEVGVALASRGATYPVTVKLEGRDARIRPGMAAEVSFDFAPRGGVERMVVPAQSVQEDGKGRFVFVVEPGEDGTGIARRRNVEVGELSGEGLELLSGLEDGELLITAGWSKVHDGLSVRLAR